MPKVCDCLGLALVCCMSWTPIPITVSTVWQWIMPRLHAKIKQRDLKGESHMFKLKEGAEGREPFQFRGVFVGHVDIKDWIGGWETRALLKFLLSDLKIESQVQVEGSGLGTRVNFKTLSRVVCCQTNCLSAARRLVSVARLCDEGANPLFVCCHLSSWSRKGRWISVPKVCDCLGLAMVCCMSWIPIPITVSTVWQWIMPRPHVKIKQRDFEGESHMFKLKEGAGGREPFQFKGGVRGPCWH